MSPSEVLEVITQGALQFKRDRLKVSTQITNTVGGGLTKGRCHGCSRSTRFPV